MLVDRSGHQAAEFSVQTLAASLAQLGQAEFSAGEPEAARSNYAESKAIFEAIGDDSRAAQVTVRIARIDLEGGDLASAEGLVNDVLEAATREALQEPLIEAMELDGDIANRRADSAGAIDAYERTIRRIDETGFVADRTRVTVKLANLLLDAGELARAEPLIGNLIEAGESADALRVRARYAQLQGESTRASELMETLQSRHADSWTEADAQTLEQYRSDVTRTR